MTTYLPKEIQDGLDAARVKAMRKSSRLRVVADDVAYPILSMRENGFSVALDGVPHLRGLVDVQDGARPLWQCLIVASEEDGLQMHYEFKRQTAVTDRPALDFERSADAPAGYLTQL